MKHTTSRNPFKPLPDPGDPPKIRKIRIFWENPDNPGIPYIPYYSRTGGCLLFPKWGLGNSLTTKPMKLSCQRRGQSSDLHPDGFGSIECSSGDRVELQVLVEGPSRLSAVGKSLFLVVDCKEVKGGDEQNRDSEWDTAPCFLHTQLSGNKGIRAYQTQISSRGGL